MSSNKSEERFYAAQENVWVINIVLCLMLNKIYCIILYHILDNALILSIEYLSKIDHILFKPAINYNYYADTIQ